MTSSNTQDLLERAQRELRERNAKRLNEARGKLIAAEDLAGVRQFLRSKNGEALIAYLERRYHASWADTDAERCRRLAHVEVVEDIIALRDLDTGETSNG